MDSHQWRVYSAEQSIDPGASLDGVEQARALVRRVRRSAWWRDVLGYVTRVRVVVDGTVNAQGTWSYAQPDRYFLARSHTLHMHPTHLKEIIVLHELAHCLSPSFTGDPRRIARGYLDHAPLHPHGSGFTGMLSELVSRFGTGINHEQLTDAYRHFEVQVDPLEDVLRDRLLSLEVEAAAQAQLEDLQSRGTRRQRRGCIPDFPWGWWLLKMRKWESDRPHLGRARLAELISPVERCAARDIKTLEDSRERPEDLRLRRIGLAAAAVLGVDPVWARTELGLVRWECGIDLGELATVAPGWVANVEHLNELLASRPVYWEAEGER